jgi:hypothetical protein
VINAAREVLHIVNEYAKKNDVKLSEKDAKTIKFCQTLFKLKSLVRSDNNDEKELLTPEIEKILENTAREADALVKKTKHDAQIALCAHEVGSHCLKYLNDAKPSGVSFALQELTAEQRADILNYWFMSEEIQFKLLYFYYLPAGNHSCHRNVDSWSMISDGKIEWLENQLQQSNLSLPKFLNSALKIKLDLYNSIYKKEDKKKQAIAKLRDLSLVLKNKQDPVWHLNLEGMRLYANPLVPGFFESAFIPGANFAYADIDTSFKKSDISYTCFRLTYIQGMNLESANVRGCDFKGIYLSSSEKNYGDELTGITDASIKAYFDTEALSFMQPLIDYFNKKTHCLFKNTISRQEYCLAIYLMGMTDPVIGPEKFESFKQMPLKARHLTYTLNDGFHEALEAISKAVQGEVKNTPDLPVKKLDKMY